MKAHYRLIAALSALAVWMPAHAQFAKPEDAVKYRKSSLFVMQQHWARVGAMAQGRVPFDAKVAQDNMEVVSTLAKLPWAAFTEGTDKGDTRAKPEIWKESAKFKEAADKFQAEVVKLNAAAKTGNLDNLKAAFGSAAPTCKACHDNFRKD
ncbi:MAG: c-type cytochrome [Limnohabitans sp.]